MTGVPLLDIRDVHKIYPLPRQKLLSAPEENHAVQGVSLTVQRGQTMGIVGESGSGKSTLARLAMALEKPSSGEVWFDGTNLTALSADAIRPLRPQFQMVFQDPFSSLNPRMQVASIIAEPLLRMKEISATERQDRVAEMVDAVGLRPGDLKKYPHEFSGGQRQRIAIARAIVTRPALVVADEPVSALDVSVQAQILNLFMDLQDRYGLAYFFISHDLGVVATLADHVMVMQRGKVVERGTVADIFRSPQQDYTKDLLAAAVV